MIKLLAALLVAVGLASAAQALPSADVVLLTGGASPCANVALSADFAPSPGDLTKGQSCYLGVAYPSPTAIPGWTFSRASVGTATDCNGNVVTFASGQPRITCAGLLVEQSSTNQIRNSTMQGAAAGTPGTAPTNWSIISNNAITANITGVGTEFGLNYIEITVSGTPTGSPHLEIYYNGDVSGTIAGLTGQNWTISSYIRFVSGSPTQSGITAITHRLDEYTSGGAYITTDIGADFQSQLSANIYRASTPLLTSGGATTAYLVPWLSFSGYSGGTAVNYTVRIYAPQFEQASFATSYIPTSTVAVTRAADNAYIAGNFIGTGNYGFLTSVASVTPSQGSSYYPNLAGISDGTYNNSLYPFSQAGGPVVGFNQVAGGTIGAAGSAVGTNALASGSAKVGLLRVGSTIYAGANGSLPNAQAGTYGVFTPNRIEFGQAFGSNQLNGVVKSVTVLTGAKANAVYLQGQGY